MQFQRFFAIILVAIPVILGMYGIKQLRDVFFGYLNSPYPTLWVQFLAGLAAFGVGLYLIGSFILYRDRKRNKVQPRFSKKNK
jgi:hypothetical protein